MFDSLTAARSALDSALADIDPTCLVGKQPARGVELIVAIERTLAAKRLALTARVEDMRHWEHEGFGSFEEWLAATHGESYGQARRRSSRARKLQDCDATADALADGDISEEQADVVADAADKNPQAEQGLLDTAKNQNRSHRDLKKKAARSKASAESDTERARRLREGRTAGAGPDHEGFFGLRGRFQPDVGAEIDALFRAETNRIFALNRRAGRREPLDRYRADALAALILGRDPDTVPAPTQPNTPPEHKDEPPATGGSADPDTTAPAPAPAPAPVPTPAQKELVLIVDLAALRRGCVNPGDTCEIRGIGPVPVEIARQWAEDAFIKAVIVDGTDPKIVSHLGRHIPAHLRTALDLLEPACAVPRCDNPRLEYHHLHPSADHGPTQWDNLGRPCEHHHDLITHRGYRLEGTPGDRRWINPDNTIEQADDPIAVGRPASVPTKSDPPAPPSPPTDTGVDLGAINDVDAFDQLLLNLEPARAP